MAIVAEHGLDAAVPTTSGYSRLRTAYITFVLALVFLLASADRNIMSILLVPIQKDLGATDTQMGLLAGAAFSLVYATVALPLARFADRGHRRNLIAAALAFWSAMTAVCGLAGSYLSLLLARVGVAAGESAHQPAILSMVGDLYSRKRRGIAIGVIFAGTSIGIALSAYLAGLLNDLYGWQSAFFAMGLPGLLVAALVLFTIPEPRRGGVSGEVKPDPAHASFWQSVKYLAGVRSVRRILVAKILLNIGFAGFLVWAPAFFIRVHGMSATEIGAVFGASVGFGGVAAQLIAGLSSDWLAARGERWRSWWCTVCLLAGVPFILMIIFGSTQTAIVGMFMIAIVTGGATTASVAAGLGVVRNTMRGFMTAGMMFCVSVFGMALGPVILGGVSDLLKAVHGEEAIRYALLAVPIAWVLSGAAFWFAGLRADYDAAVAEGDIEASAAGR